MKGISFIVILSIVWSVISGIIEKQKKAAKLKQANLDVSTPTKVKRTPEPTPWKPDPKQVKVERLRRKQNATLKTKTAQVAPPQPPVTVRKQVQDTPRQIAKPEKKIGSIKALHAEACDLKPISEQIRKKPAPARQIAKLLKNRRSLRTAIVLTEVLSPPLARR